MERRRVKSHPDSAPGDFYVVNDECISCGAPHAAAPDLIGWASDPERGHCIWKKQPETAKELQQAFDAFSASCVGCYRYAGTDAKIIEKVGAGYCDQALLVNSRSEPRNNHPTEFNFTLIEGSRSHVYGAIRAAAKKISTVLRGRSA